MPLTDPSDPAFERLPRVDLDDGRALRRAAFDAWAAAVRAEAAAGREFEATFRAARPHASALTIVGAAAVQAVSLVLLWRWSSPPAGNVRVEPTFGEGAATVLAVALVVGLLAASFAAALRAWLCRGGSYARLSARGVVFRKGGRAEPFDAVAGAAYHPLVRCTRVEFADGRPPLWIPAERGALRRLDLLLGALDDRLGASLRRGL